MAIPDVIAVGAADGPVAACLAEKPALSILLLEAGKDHGLQATMPPDLLDGGRLASMVHDRNYTAIPIEGRTLCAGALGTPATLLRSGIGLAAELAAWVSRPCRTGTAAQQHDDQRWPCLPGCWWAIASISGERHC